MMMKSLAVFVGMVVIMFTYNVRLTLCALLLISPSILVSKSMMKLLMRLNKRYQTVKANMSSHATERISLIRTVKAFADEKASIELMDKLLYEVLERGKHKAYAFSILMLSVSTLTSLSFVGIMYLASLWFEEDNMSVG